MGIVVVVVVVVVAVCCLEPRHSAIVAECSLVALEL